MCISLLPRKKGTHNSKGIRPPAPVVNKTPIPLNAVKTEGPEPVKPVTCPAEPLLPRPNLLPSRNLLRKLNLSRKKRSQQVRKKHFLQRMRIMLALPTSLPGIGLVRLPNLSKSLISSTSLVILIPPNSCGLVSRN